ncbi:MAG: LapA family protein [Deltaproteobacteria bacterium]|nr:LapA family protein [Deltaproteobacteria bacterium]
MNVRLILILILVSVVVMFIVQNVAAVEVTFLLWSISMSRSLLIFFTLIIGFVIGWFLHSYLSYRKSKNELADDA